jgi:hypothetical protein
MASPLSSSHIRRLIAACLAAWALAFAVARVEADAPVSTLLVVGDSISAAYGLRRGPAGSTFSQPV